MNLVFRYFWALMLVVIALNVVSYRFRLRRLEAEGGISRAESDRLLRGTIVWFGGFMLALAAVQLAAGWPSPFCLHSRPLTDPFVRITLAVTVIAYAVLATWIFAWGGAELLSRASPALGRRARSGGWSPRSARIFTVLLLVVGAAGFIVPRLQPQPCEPPIPAARREKRTALTAASRGRRPTGRPCGVHPPSRDVVDEVANPLGSE